MDRFSYARILKTICNNFIIICCQWKKMGKDSMGFSIGDNVFHALMAKSGLFSMACAGGHFIAWINMNYRDSYRFFDALKFFSSIIMKKMSGYLWTGRRNVTILTAQLYQAQRGLTGWESHWKCQRMPAGYQQPAYFESTRTWAL